MKKIFRLTEGDLRTMIKSSINKIINESYRNNIDWDRVDTIEFKCWYDKDDLKEAIDSGEIEKINFLKLDVEGSEMATLRGARNSIDRFKPKLAISIYHKPDDFFEIINYIK